jgi:hypothetical protein
MLGSDHLGEVSNAGRLADRMVRGAGLRWADLIAPALSSPQPPRDPWPSVLRDWPARWREALTLCQRSDVPLPGKSREFLRQIAGYSHQPSPAQLTWLAGIVAKCRAGP